MLRVERRNQRENPPVSIGPAGEMEPVAHPYPDPAAATAGRRPPDPPQPPQPPPRRSFAGNALWLLIAEATGKVASFVFVVVVARNLGAGDYGAFAFAIAFMAPFYRLSSWGVDSVTISEVAKDHAEAVRILPAGLAVRSALGLLALLVALGIAPLFVDGRPLAALAVLGVALLLDEISQYLSAVFRAFERMEFHAIVVFTNRVLSVLLALAIFAAGGKLLAVCIAYLAGSFGAMVFGFFFLARFLPDGMRWRPDRTTLRHMLKTGAPLGIAGAVNMLAFRADTVILQAVKGTVAVAQYSVAYRFFDSLAFVAYNLGDTAMPRIARTGKGRDAGRTFMLTAAAILAFYLPLAVAYVFAGRWIVVTLFSDAYAEAAPALMWLGAAAALYGIAFLARVSCISLGRRREITWIAVIALAANLSINAFTIPRWSGTGAAAATFFTEVVEAILLAGLFLRTNAGQGSSTTKPILVPIGAAALAAGFLAATGLRDLAALLGGGVVYGAALVGLAAVAAPDDSRELRRLVRNRFSRGGGVRHKDGR